MSTTLNGAVVAVAGAGGGAGAAVVRQLVAAGATVEMADRSTERLEPLESASGGAAHGYAVDLLDASAVQKWAAAIDAKYGRIDGVVHLVGGWRGGAGITQADLADWSWLSDRLVGTVQHTSRAFHDGLLSAAAGRFVLVSAAEASRPTAKNASYAAAKAAAEAWTLAVADSFRNSSAAASIVIVKALVTPAMREAQPDRAFKGYTDVADLATEIVELWDRPADEVNGERLWLTD